MKSSALLKSILSTIKELKNDGIFCSVNSKNEVRDLNGTTIFHRFNLQQTAVQVANSINLAFNKGKAVAIMEIMANLDIGESDSDIGENISKPQSTFTIDLNKKNSEKHDSEIQISLNSREFEYLQKWVNDTFTQHECFIEDPTYTKMIISSMSNGIGKGTKVSCEKCGLSQDITDVTVW